MSSVLLTVPSVEFSIGTTPKSAAPDSTSWKTSSTDVSGSGRTECPKYLSTACCVNVPSGTEVADLERVLLREARGHDLAEQPQDLFVAQRAALFLVALAAPGAAPATRVPDGRSRRCGRPRASTRRPAARVCARSLISACSCASTLSMRSRICSSGTLLRSPPSRRGAGGRGGFGSRLREVASSGHGSSASVRSGGRSTRREWRAVYPQRPARSGRPCRSACRRCRRATC